MMTDRTILVFLRVLAAGLMLLTAASLLAVSAHADEYTAEDVEVWLEWYSAKYATPAYPYSALLRDSTRIARCESVGFDSRVINNEWRGRLGEVGTFQFLPGPRSIFWATPTAELGFDYWDPESNVAAAVYLLAHGYARHWSCK